MILYVIYTQQDKIFSIYSIGNITYRYQQQNNYLCLRKFIRHFFLCTAYLNYVVYINIITGSWVLVQVRQISCFWLPVMLNSLSKNIQLETCLLFLLNNTKLNWFSILACFIRPTMLIATYRLIRVRIKVYISFCWKYICISHLNVYALVRYHQSMSKRYL